MTDFRWIPSHLDESAGEDPFEDWIIHWNAMADNLATHTNRWRSQDFWHRHCAIKAALDNMVVRLHQLRRFYFAVAGHKDDGPIPSPQIATILSSDEEEEEALWIPWEDLLPVTWQQQQCSCSRLKIPHDFLIALVHWICAAERLGDEAKEISDIELVFDGS